MRKWMLHGLFALSCGILANSALAGNVADCDILTDPDPDNTYYAPKLYGLCVAWHNANENAKDALAAKFKDRAGFEVPGSETPEPTPDFTCPCWPNTTIEDICAFGAPSDVETGDYSQYGMEGEFTIVSFVYDSVEFGATVTEEFVGDSFIAFSPACGHTITEGSSELYNGNMTNIDPVDAEVCYMEANVIASLYNSTACDAFDP